MESAKMLSCWQCFKLFSETEVFDHIDKRMFCSNQCFSRYQELNSVRKKISPIFNQSLFEKTICMNDHCKRTFLKDTGLLEDNHWYCSKQCLEDNRQEHNEGLAHPQAKYEEDTKEAFSKEDSLEEPEAQEDSETEETHKDIDLDFSDIPNKMDSIVTLEQLEKKYLRNREVGKK